jgi:hypothetical protein
VVLHFGLFDLNLAALEDVVDVCRIMRLYQILELLVKLIDYLLPIKLTTWSHQELVASTHSDGYSI